MVQISTGFHKNRPLWCSAPIQQCCNHSSPIPEQISSYEHEKVTCKIQSACAPLKLSCDITHTEKEPTFKKRTLRPEAVNMGTWNSIWMGGLVQVFLSTMVDISSTSALIVNSVCPGNFLTLHAETIANHILNTYGNLMRITPTLRCLK